MNVLKISVVVAALSSMVWAQVPEPSPPPLIPADPRPEVPAGALPTPPPTPPADPNALPPDSPPAALVPQSQPSLGQGPATLEADAPPRRPLRLGMSLLIGTGGGVVMGLAGLGLGALAPKSFLPEAGGGLALGAVVGFAVGVPIGVLISGLLFDGDGSVLATLGGDLLGFLVGAGSVYLGGVEAIPLCFLGPLAGSVLGYEITSNDHKAKVVPTVSIVPGHGATVGVAGMF